MSAERAVLLRRTVMPSPVGQLTLYASPAGLRAVLFPADTVAADGVPRRVTAGLEGPSTGDDDAPVLVAARAQLEEYFAHRREVFDLPLDPVGTPFQLAVWGVLRTIRFGETISYGEQARRLGDARRARAVGAANGRNPLSIVVPCHRVVAADGALRGFGGGLPAKAWLLDHEAFAARRGAP